MVAIDHELLVAVDHKFDEYVDSVRSVVVGIVKGTDMTPLEVCQGFNATTPPTHAQVRHN